MHHGSVLREFLSVRGIKQSSAARQLGIHVNTLRNWMGMEKLDARSLELLIRNWPELGTLLPRPVTSNYNLAGTLSPLVSESSAPYGVQLAEGRGTMSAGDLADRYMRLLERYTELLEKHLEVMNGLKTA